MLSILHAVVTYADTKTNNAVLWSRAHKGALAMVKYITWGEPERAPC